MIGTKEEIIKILQQEQNSTTLYELNELGTKRSKNANNYLWSLINKIAIKIKSTSDEVYRIMLKRYSSVEMISVRADINIDAYFKNNNIKYYEEAGIIILKNIKYKNYKIYLGSSEMNTKQMSRLIDGVIDECKALDIETMAEDYIKRLKEEEK